MNNSRQFILKTERFKQGNHQHGCSLAKRGDVFILFIQKIIFFSLSTVVQRSTVDDELRYVKTV